MKIDYVGICDKGSNREENQDAIAMFSTEEIGVFVVADGMGGHTNGEKASQTIVREISNWWQLFSEMKYEYDFQKMLLSIEQTMENANRLIYQNYNKGEICGSTAVILFVYKGKYGVIYAGDSRCYIYQNRQMKQITLDEVWENQTGLSDDERNDIHHPNRGKLFNAVGIKPSIQCRVQTDQITSEAVFLVCSDGLYKMCQDRYIKKCLKRCNEHQKMRIMSEKLLAKTYQNGARDNISFLIVRLE